MSMWIDRYLVPPDRRVALDEIDPDDAKSLSKKQRTTIETDMQDDLAELRALQERLFAEKTRALLIVLLAIDCGGKDSTVDRIFSGINPQSCVVTGFGVPSDEERAHDFLWRIHHRVPRAGMIGIFNRSHYEDVTVTRVNGSIDRDTGLDRCRHIRAFERLLHDRGTHVLKFHLRISRKEQADRLRDRLEDPTKHWKFNPSDLQGRERWDEHQAAFEDAVNATSTDDAPWHIVPANSKWYRDAIVTRAIVERLRAMDPRYPPPVEGLERYRVE
ncbi:MAG TPA: PPK2 family polyphosphate kinase [Thermomicrobiales bacterium]|nr:PPK2 family polyphosphate kinase [Thermomicrobiales bacterium]